MKITAAENSAKIELSTVETGVILKAWSQAIVLTPKELHLTFAALAVYFDSRNESIENVLSNDSFEIKIKQ